MNRFRCAASAFLLLLARPVAAGAEDGHELWLRYRLVADTARRSEYGRAVHSVALDGASPTLAAARDELLRGARGLLGRDLPRVADARITDGTIVAGTPASSRAIASLRLGEALRPLGDEGVLLRST